MHVSFSFSVGNRLFFPRESAIGGPGEEQWMGDWWRHRNAFCDSQRLGRTSKGSLTGNEVFGVSISSPSEVNQVPESTEMSFLFPWLASGDG